MTRKFPWILLTILTVCFAARPAQAEIGVVQAVDGQPAFWLRHVARLTPPEEDSRTTLQVRGLCRATVYVNGQRLARNVELTDGSVVQFDITELIRRGPNGISLAAHQTLKDQPATAAIWVSHNGAAQKVATGPKWKQRNTPPPIGWQQTDFNPHGWQNAAVAGTLTLKQVASDDVQPQQWRRNLTQSGHDTALSLTDGDHVVLLGSTFIERAQLYGHLEAMLTAFAVQGHVTFRNLGWSGDTIDARSRGIFDTPQKGYERLVEHVRAEEPTVVMVCYGQNEAMDDATKESVNTFGRQLQQLYQDLSSTGARFVFVSPHPLLSATPPIPSPNRFNPAIEDYAVEMQQVARELDVTFVDLFSGLPDALGRAQSALLPDSSFNPDLITASAEWTDNGMHWNEPGYRRIAVMLTERCLKKELSSPVIRVNAAEQSVEAQGGSVRNVKWGSNGRVEFEFRASHLSPFPCIVDISTNNVQEDLRRIAVNSSAGPLRLVASKDAESSLRFVGITDEQYEQLRSEVVSKNELYFHRWRPQNITYLYGFRKHEQGNNAAEIAMFDPLVDERERKIEALQEPQWQTLTITR